MILIFEIILINAYILLSCDARLLFKWRGLTIYSFWHKRVVPLIRNTSRYKLLKFISKRYELYKAYYDYKSIRFIESLTFSFKEQQNRYIKWYLFTILISIIVPFIYTMIWNSQGLSFWGFNLSILYLLFIYGVSATYLAHFAFNKQHKKLYNYKFRFLIVFCIYLVFIPSIIWDFFMIFIYYCSNKLGKQIDLFMNCFRVVLLETIVNKNNFIGKLIIFALIIRSFLFLFNSLAVQLGFNAVILRNTYLFFIFLLFIYIIKRNKYIYLKLLQILRNIFILSILFNLIFYINNDLGLLYYINILSISFLGESFTTLFTKFITDSTIYFYNNVEKPAKSQLGRPIHPIDADNLIRLIEDKLPGFTPWLDMTTGNWYNPNSVYNLVSSSLPNILPVINLNLETMDNAKDSFLRDHFYPRLAWIRVLSYQVHENNTTCRHLDINSTAPELPDKYIRSLNSIELMPRYGGDTNEAYFKRMILASVSHIWNIARLREALHWVDDVYDHFHNAAQLSRISMTERMEMLATFLKTEDEIFEKGTNEDSLYYYDLYELEPVHDTHFNLKNFLSYDYIQGRALIESRQAESRFVRYLVCNTIPVFDYMKEYAMYIKIFLDLQKNILPTIFYLDIAEYIKDNKINISNLTDSEFNDIVSKIYKESLDEHRCLYENYDQDSRNYINLHRHRWLHEFNHTSEESPTYKPLNRGLNTAYDFGHKPIKLNEGILIYPEEVKPTYKPLKIGLDLTPKYGYKAIKMYKGIIVTTPETVTPKTISFSVDHEVYTRDPKTLAFEPEMFSSKTITSYVKHEITTKNPFRVMR